MARSKCLTELLIDVERWTVGSRSFTIPSREDREDLWPGDLANLLFEGIGKGMWVRVVEAHVGGIYVGVLESSRLGIMVLFGAENVAGLSRKTHPRFRSDDRPSEAGIKATVVTER